MVDKPKQKKKKEVVKRDVTQRGTAAPTTTPSFRRTIQGDRFDVNLPISRSQFSSQESFDQASAIKKTGGRGGTLDTGRVATPERLRETQLLREEQRQEEVRQQLGTEPVREELEQKIAEPPELAPEQTILERGAGVGLTPAVAIGNLIGKGLETAGIVEKFTPQTTRELTKTTAGKALGAATLGTGVALAATVVAPYVAAAAARSTIIKGVLGTGGSAAILKTAIAGLGIFVVGPGIFDFRGDEMDNLRQGLKKVVEDGERIEAANRNGFPTGDTIELLTTMTEEVNSAESRIKELGNNNLNYRVSKEYVLDTQNVRSAREAILRRVLAVQNIALTGQAQLDPEALMFNAAQFKGR